MPNYMVFRSVVPPGFNMREYSKHSSEPLRFDTVTVVEADTARDAVNAVSASTGIVNNGFAVAEVEMIGFGTQGRQSFGYGGVLKAAPDAQTKTLTESNDDRLERLQREIDQIKELSN